MTQGERVKVKLNLLNAHVINEISKYLIETPKAIFFKKTWFTEKDLQKMINLEYEWDLQSIAIVSDLIGFDIILIGKAKTNYKNRE